MPGNNSSATFHFLCGRYPGRLGWLFGPAAMSKTKLRHWIDFAIDNDAFMAFATQTEWNYTAWSEFLIAIHRTRKTPRWVLVPDKVGDRQATLDLWETHKAEAGQFGWKLAFAVQDGMTPDDVPSDADVVFVGGTTEWKWKSLPMWSRFPRVHVGRVNALHRLYACERLGVESVDGTGWFRDSEEGGRVDDIQTWLKDPRSPQLDLF